MIQSSFFLESEWPAVCEAAWKVEMPAHPDPRTACSYARLALVRRIPGWENAQLEPDRAREPDRRPLDGARYHGAGTALRIAIHRFTSRGPDELFTAPQLDELLAVLDQVKASALAA
jgi:hypothetical protein